ncbi:acyl-CoA dehydrogenase family protein [Streptomyces sp. LP11]|uniref:Acyl-CoA dehydrogenase family protein n=1 Tax=Streptomyces pyxinicus TaxID=2970331 RepID=A0ABT2B5L1_9ACTN|nr:acyl-CoA dehydrogenase family protein [Streptomyces sp. LP11]
MPDGLVRGLGDAGLLAADLPARHGGRGLSASALGTLCARLGGVCTALRSVVTVQGMVAAALSRWGTDEQRARLLPALVRGERLAAFAATEDGAGTELSAVEAELRRDGTDLVLHGTKRWVSLGEIADVFLVLARLDGKPATVLVEAGGAGVCVDPVRGQLGLRAAHVAHVRFDGVRLPARDQVAPAGFGLSHVVGTALDHGRFTIAWGCAGMAGTCLELAARHTAARVQGGVRLSDHQAVRAALGRGLAAVAAARALCLRAAESRQDGTPAALSDTVVAKYTAARTAADVSQDAVQLLGAAGCAPGSAVGRFFRDARITQLIEGAELVAEVRMGDLALREHAVARPAAGRTAAEGAPW